MECTELEDSILFIATLRVQGQSDKWCLKSEVLTLSTMKGAIFSDMTPCSLVEAYRTASIFKVKK
jgi:hypothetical protein